MLIPYDRTEGRIPYREIPASNLFEICLESVAAPQDWENMFDMRRKYSIDVYADPASPGATSSSTCYLRTQIGRHESSSKRPRQNPIVDVEFVRHHLDCCDVAWISQRVWTLLDARPDRANGRPAVSSTPVRR